MQSPIDLKPSPRESPLQPGFNEYLLDGVPVNFAKVENPDFRFSPFCLIVSTGNLHHLKALLILVNLSTYMLGFLQLHFHFRFRITA